MMRFSHSDECLALIESAARFVNDHYSSPEFGNEPDATFNAARWREFAEFGWLAIIVDEQADVVVASVCHRYVVPNPSLRLPSWLIR